MDKLIICDNLLSINGISFNIFTKEQLTKLNISPTEGGATWLDEKTGLCIVRIDSSRTRKIIKFTIAYELAHVFFNHPKKGIGAEEADKEANEKAEDWGFIMPPV